MIDIQHQMGLSGQINFQGSAPSNNEEMAKQNSLS